VEQLEHLEKLYKYANSALYGIIPQDEHGNLLMVLPHAFCDPDLNESIARKAQLIWDDEMLVVIDENSASGVSAEK
jgi:hypothetical protein